MFSTLPAPGATFGGDVPILHRDLRASDRDREQAVALLKAHYAEGRLAEHELAWRSDAAYRAVGLRDLHLLTSDLPVPAPVPARHRRSHHVAIGVLVLAIAAWLVIVPPEVTLALLLVFCVLAVLAGFLLSPLWIPLVLAFIAYRV